MVEEPEQAAGITRVASSLELLSHTAAWKNDMEKAGIEEVSLATRVSPADSVPESPQRLTPTVSESWTFGLAESKSEELEGYSPGHSFNNKSPKLSSFGPRGAASYSQPPPAQATFVPPRPPPMDSKLLQSKGESTLALTMRSQAPMQWLADKTILNENERLKKDLEARDEKILALEEELGDLRKRMDEYRQLPTGKISQIPIVDMVALMQEYGSEVSESATPPRNMERVQKASIIRQFRRWNPNFFSYFEHRGGKWTPKLGRKQELERRAAARRRNGKKKAKA